ncbi:MAG: glycoside hydrolase family 19 protein [Massilia sp.]
MNHITQQQLRDILAAPDGDPRPGLWTDALNACMEAGAINTNARQAAFLAQVLLESGELRQLQESLSYSAQRLRQVWPQRFPTDAAAEACSHNPEKLANKVYASRMGNGDEASGDGWKYRGRGLIQLTGHENYARFATAMKVDALANPDLLQQPAGAALSAAWFWQSKGLNEVADLTIDKDGDAHFIELTRRINGGTNGLLQRRAYWDRARLALGVPIVKPA